MSEEPNRWKDSEDAPARMRDLLRKGGDVPPMPADVRAAVLASLPAIPPPPAPTPTVKGLSASPVAIGAGAVAVVGIVVAVLLLGRSDPHIEPTPTPQPSIQVVPSATEARSVEPAPPLVPSIEPTPKASAPARSPAPVAGDTLAEELVLIARAQESIGSNPQSALTAIDEHARRFPRGQLAPEREYLRVRALRRLGRVDEAKTKCRAYLANFPSSPHAKAVRDILTELEAQ